MVANRMVQLDHMTRGRVMFGVGPGLLASDALMLGIDPMVQRDRMAQAIDVILRLLNGEVVTETTDWYSLHEARLHLLAVHAALPGDGRRERRDAVGGRLAGKHDLGMLCVAAGERAGFDVLDVNWKIACEIAAENGRTMDTNRLRLVVPMHLADTREQAVANVRYGLKQFIDYFNNNQPRFFPPEGADTVDWYVGEKIGVIGTPDDAIERIEALQAKQGEFGAILLQANNWADWEQTKRSYELYARYVMPHFSGANRARDDSYRWVSAHTGQLTDLRKAAAREDVRSARGGTWRDRPAGSIAGSQLALKQRRAPDSKPSGAADDASLPLDGGGDLVEREQVQASRC